MANRPRTTASHRGDCVDFRIENQAVAALVESVTEPTKADPQPNNFMATKNTRNHKNGIRPGSSIHDFSCLFVFFVAIVILWLRLRRAKPSVEQLHPERSDAGRCVLGSGIRC